VSISMCQLFYQIRILIYWFLLVLFVRKVIKMCTFALCYLSMEPSGEAKMAKEGAILALNAVQGHRGQTLLPTIVQTFYNMTCTEVYFEAIPRIIKALLTICSAGFDGSDWLVKTLINCARDSAWLMRRKMIDDGGMAYLNSLLQSLNSRDNSNELSVRILVVLNMLSDSVNCRGDMISKGVVDMCRSLLQFCDDSGKQLVVRILHNFLMVQGMKNSDIECTVHITTSIAKASSDTMTLQYCAACFHILSRDKLKHDPVARAKGEELNVNALSVMLIDCMHQLLQQEDPLIQYFTVSTAGNIFFGNLW
jgi:hypothetical protein